MQPIHPVLHTLTNNVSEETRSNDAREQAALQEALIPYLRLSPITAIVRRLLRNPMTTLLFLPTDTLASTTTVPLDHWEKNELTCLQLVSTQQDQFLYGQVHATKKLLDLRTLRHIPIAALFDQVNLTGDSYHRHLSLHDGSLYNSSDLTPSSTHLPTFHNRFIPRLDDSSTTSFQRYDALSDSLYLASKKGDVWILKGDLNVQHVLHTGIEHINFCLLVNPTTLLITSSAAGLERSLMTLWSLASKGVTHQTTPDDPGFEFHSAIVFPDRNECVVGVGDIPTNLYGGVFLYSTTDLSLKRDLSSHLVSIKAPQTSLCQAGEYDICIAGSCFIELFSLQFQTTMYNNIRCKNSNSSLFQARPPIFFEDRLFVFIKNTLLKSKPVTLHQFVISDSSSSASAVVKK